MKRMKSLFLAVSLISCMIFSSLPIKAASVSESQIDGAINWAKSVSFNTGFNGKSFSGYCLAYVQLAYSSQGVTVGRWGNAHNAGTNLIISEDMNPPKGALVFFSNRNGLGHIGIALGDGTYIHAASSSKAITPLTSYNSTFALQYRGWGYPGKGNVLATANNSPAPSSNTYTAYVTGTDGSLVINSRPSAGYGISEIPENGAVTVDESRKSGNWLWVTYNGVSGYSYNRYLTATKPYTPPAQTVASSSSNTYTAYVTGTDGSLVINSRPSAGYGISEIPENGAVTVDASRKSGNWLWVTFNGVSGYSYYKYLTTAQSSAPVSSNTRTAVVVNTGGRTLAINSIPKAGNQIGKIPEGAQITVYTDKTSGNWYWVSYGGVSGYSYKDYISLR